VLHRHCAAGLRPRVYPLQTVSFETSRDPSYAPAVSGAPALWFGRLCCVLAAAVLSACTSIPQRLSTPPAMSVADADAFSFSGRISLREQDRHLSGSIRWTHEKAHDDILVLSPLGQGVMRIERNADGASLQTADGRIVHAADAEHLAQEVTGWRMPVDGLVHWVRGLAVPGASASEERDASGRLSILSQQDWRIEFAEYFDAPDDRLPRRIVLTRPEFELKLHVDAWERSP
jgi:outer membrane lipoprotein LolB